MPVVKSLGLLLAEAMLGAITVKLRQRNIDQTVSICAELAQVEDLVATMFCQKGAVRYAWVAEACEGEGILLLLASYQSTTIYSVSGGHKRYVLKDGATRHLVSIDQYGDVADMILNYIIDGMRP